MCTGRPLSKATLWAHGAVRPELASYAKASKQELTFEGLTQTFYDGLRDYILGPAGRSPRTFNTYVKRLRSFLCWVEGQDLPAPPKFRKVLKLVQRYVGKEALTQAEILRVAAIDFASPALQDYLAAAFPKPVPRSGRSGRGELSSAEHVLPVVARHLPAMRLYEPAPRRCPGAGLVAYPEQEFIDKALNKTTVVGLIPHLYADVFNLVALLEKYWSLRLQTYLPSCVPLGCICLTWHCSPWLTRLKYPPMHQKD